MKRKEQAVVQGFQSLQASMPRYLKPYIGDDNKAYVVNFKGGDPNNIDNYEETPVTNASLLYDEWRTLDTAVQQIAESRLVGVQDLRDNNLTYNLNNPMATTVLTWQTMSDAGSANVGIDPVQRGRNFAPDFDTQHLPIPVTYTDYQIGERYLQESRAKGNGIDAANAERAARKIAEKWENMLFGENAIMTYGGGTIDTYLTHSDVSAVTLSQNWDASGKTATEIKDDVKAVIQKSIDNYFYGPWVLYIPTAYQTIIDDDYKNTSAGSSQTIRQRLEAFDGLQKVKVADKLPADTVLLVQMTSDVVQWVDGMSMQNVEWNSEGGMMHYYKVMGIQLPRIRSDYEGRTGIVKLS